MCARVLIDSSDTYANYYRFGFFSPGGRACCLLEVVFNIYFWRKRCFFSIVNAVLKRDFQDVHSKNLLALQY